jgi:tetratricopeptide (TPR) repeat protein
MRSLILLSLFFVPLFSLLSQSNLPETASPPEAVPPVMYQFLGHISALQPLMVSPQSYANPGNRDQILNHLKQISQLSETLDKHHQLDSASFHISIEFLKEHIRDARQSFESGNTSYSRRMLFATLNACGSCHAQVAKPGAEWKMDTDRLEGTDFQRAEFLYALRQYSQAEPIYQKIVNEFSVGVRDRFELDRSIERVMSINLRSRRDLESAATRLKEFRKNQKLPKAVLESFENWEKEIQALKSRSTPNLQSVTAAQLESFIQSVLALETARQIDPKQHLISALYLSGLIYQFINTRPSSAVSPGLLYWLASFEDSLQDDYIYSLGEFYLKECIVRYPASEAASLCYMQLEQKLVASFTGSAGVEVPADVQATLNRLSAWIRRAQQKK